MAAAERDRQATPSATNPDSKAGVLAATGAFGIWGFQPIYFKVMADVSPVELVAHRVVWSLIFVALLLALTRTWRDLGRALAARRNWTTFAATAGLISVNWGIFIWAISVDRLLEASLGYFINPLVNVLLGRMVLGERLSRWRWLAVALAAAGVINLILAAGVVPWVALALALTFAVYGLLRKTAAVESLTGLALETALLAPLAVGYLAFLAASGAGTFGRFGLGHDLALMAAGPVTAVPLLLFARGARRLSLSTLGLLQYMAPSLHFLLALLIWHEPFTAAHVVTFACIWFGLALFSWESLRR